jgi:hypothetical protein
VVAPSTVAFVSPPTDAVVTTTTDAVLAAGAADDRGAILYSSVTPLVCSVNPLTGILSFSTFGYCIVAASQAADSTDGYASGSVETSITVTSPDFLIFVSSPTNAVITTTTDTVLAAGAAGDQGAITYTSETPTLCLVGNTDGNLAYLESGSCVIQATQKADATDGYASATAATSISVTTPDLLMFVSPPTSALTTTTGDTVLASGSVGDEGAIMYTSESPSVCSVGSTDGALTFTAPGRCVVQAVQAADVADGFAVMTAKTTLSVTVTASDERPHDHHNRCRSRGR